VFFFLIKHDQVHKRLACNLCDYTSKSANSLANHINRRHGGRTEPPPTSDAAAKSAPTGDKSVTKTPPKFKPNFKCALCEAEFVRKDSLRCHISQHKKQGMRGYCIYRYKKKVADPMIGCDSKKQLSNQILIK
jgi:hypothetical protein